jgi:hypothetical protein
MTVLFEIESIIVDKIKLDIFGMRTSVEKSASIVAKKVINNAFESYIIPMVNSSYLSLG